MTNTWTHHLEIVPVTMVVAILVLVCCNEANNRSAPLLLLWVANVGPPRSSIWYGEEGCWPNKAAFPWSIASNMDRCSRRFQIQSWSAHWLSLLHSSARLGGVSILEDAHRLASVVVHNRRWSDEAWTSQRSSRARVGVGWVMCYHLLSAFVPGVLPV